MKFKDVIQTDREIFINTEEFSEIHRIKIRDEEYETNCIINRGIRTKDKNEQINARGLHVSTATLYIHEENLPTEIRQGNKIEIDGYRYTISQISYQVGITVIELEGYHQ